MVPETHATYPKTEQFVQVWGEEHCMDDIWSMDDDFDSWMITLIHIPMYAYIDKSTPWNDPWMRALIHGWRLWYMDEGFDPWMMALIHGWWLWSMNDYFNPCMMALIHVWWLWSMYDGFDPWMMAWSMDDYFDPWMITLIHGWLLDPWMITLVHLYAYIYWQIHTMKWTMRYKQSKRANSLMWLMTQSRFCIPPCHWKCILVSFQETPLNNHATRITNVY